MSSGDLGSIFGTAWMGGDPKEIELVENIIEKTKSGKIAWQKSGSSLFANLPAMQLSFVRSNNALLDRMLDALGGSGWNMFSIRRTTDNFEILKVEQTLKLLPPPPAPSKPVRSKLLQKVDDLYALADAKGQGEIDKAIDAIKNL
jgi:hypothetical protein